MVLCLSNFPPHDLFLSLAAGCVLVDCTKINQTRGDKADDVDTTTDVLVPVSSQGLP